MNDAGFQRARRPAQKEQRRQAILEAARDLLDAGGLEAVSLAAIAGQIGGAKSNIYRYFESREEILVRLLIAEMQDMAESLERQPAYRAGRNDMAVIAATLAGEFDTRPRLCLLISVLASTLEHNISEERLYDLKLEITAIGTRMVNALHAAAPALGIETCMAAGQAIFALVAGLWPMSNPAPNVAAVLARPEFTGFHGPFAETLQHAIHTLLAGHLALGAQA